MAATKSKERKPVGRISDKLFKVRDQFTINLYDNGFMIEVDGEDRKENSQTAKITVHTVEELLALVTEACEMERT